MEYTINKLSKMSGVSTRTLRYYDEIGLLKPARINSSGYRIYGEEQINLLQQILFYRELGLPLEKIKDIVTSEDFDCKKALYDHKSNLLNKQKQIAKLIKNVDKTLQALEGEIEMSSSAKFEGFKKDIIKENEDKYGKEIKEKYGEDRVNVSYDKFSKLTKEQWDKAQSLSNEINETLKIAMSTKNPASDIAQRVVKLHKSWLEYFGDYPVQAHLGLVQMYVDDERFKEYYTNGAGEGAAEFLRDATSIFYNAKFDETTWQWIIEE